MAGPQFEELDDLPPDGAKEADPRFPSGPWTGFFLDGRMQDRIWMELTLTFAEGRFAGAGRDNVGKFLIRGMYNVADGRCRFDKSYLGRHEVVYEGFNEGRGIWGSWKIPSDGLHGGFHIWPEGMPDPSGSTLREAAAVPVEEVELVGAGVGGRDHW